MAPRTTKKMRLAKGRRLRVTKLDSCGRLEYGDDKVAVSSGFVSVAATAQTTDTDEINVTNANGDSIIYEASVTQLRGYGIELVFAEVDPEVFALVTGQTVVLDAFGNPVGFDIDPDVDLTEVNYALEVWAGVITDEACADEGDGTYGYFLFPYLSGGILGDFTIENGGITFTITGASTKKGNTWGEGPYDVQLNGTVTPVAGPLVTAIGSSTAFRAIRVDVAPPAAYDGTRPQLDPSVDALASIAGVTEDAPSLNVAFAGTPEPDPGVGIWWEFGDGTWDYVDEDNGDTEHEYAVAGTYTVTASTNGTWVTTTVTVPEP